MASYSMPEGERQILLGALMPSRKGDLEALFVSRAGPPTIRRELFLKQQGKEPHAISLLYMIEWQDRRLTGSDGDLWLEVFCDPQGRLDYAVTNWPAAREAVAHLQED